MSSHVKKLLLGSGGLRTPQRLQAWKTEADSFLGKINEVLFIPYALKHYDPYVEKIKEADLHVGRETKGIHGFADPLEAIKNAKAIHVGGGNSFRLLSTLQQKQLMTAIREKIFSGTPYLGISAGSNLACPTLMTTNDMPIVCPTGFGALGLISIQINPHYFEGKMYYKNENEIVPYGGETRDDRIREYHEMNGFPVLGLYEGSILKVEGSDMTIKGIGGARYFLPNGQIRNLKPGDKI